MLIQFGEAREHLFQEVFVAKFDFWLVVRPARAIGLRRALPGAMDFAASAPAKSVIPFAFWIFSMGGGLMTLRLRPREARAGDHLRPGARDVHLPAQHHADFPRTRSAAGRHGLIHTNGMIFQLVIRGLDPRIHQ